GDPAPRVVTRAECRRDPSRDGRRHIRRRVAAAARAGDRGPPPVAAGWPFSLLSREKGGGRADGDAAAPDVGRRAVAPQAGRRAGTIPPRAAPQAAATTQTRAYRRRIRMT